MIRPSIESWGRYPRSEQRLLTQNWRTDDLPLPNQGSLLAFGLGRTYGDVCLNDGNNVILTRGLNHIISFDEGTGVLDCEAGIALDEILDFGVPRGWFLPVTPGTRFVTLGGAIANDVHGKNHHVCGCFGNFVDGFELLRSDQSRVWCSRESYPELFRATIGGWGLTGLITRARLRLKPIQNRLIDAESIRYGSLQEFLDLSLESESRFEYLAAWVDCLARGDGLGRGIFIRGNHNRELPMRAPASSGGGLPVPIDLPSFTLNRWTIAAFNFLYYHKQWSARTRTVTDFLPFFYPLDAVHNWNRIYGRRGLLQWQCLVPFDSGLAAIRTILTRIADSQMGSFLAVMKTMGSMQPSGMMSFSGRGITLALDFPAAPGVFRLLDRLDPVVAEHGGLLYPAKDARMSPESFRRFFPRCEEFRHWVDPHFSSSFWRRVMKIDD